MKGLFVEGSCVWLWFNNNFKRKLKWIWEIVIEGDIFVGINISLFNVFVSQFIEVGNVFSLKGYKGLKREVFYGQNL